MKLNEDLRKDILEEIQWDPELRKIHGDVGVAVKDGVVTLSGMVDSYRKKLAIENAAQRVGGTKVVASEIEVKLTSSGKRTDTEIADVIKNSLNWNSTANEMEIEIRVDNGWVYLDGKADWEYEKMAIEQMIYNLIGVRGITNTITLHSRPVDGREIRSKIMDAFQRSAAIDATAIHIEMAGSKLILKGKVKSGAERQEAEMIVWSAPGVLEVENRIEIETPVLSF